MQEILCKALAQKWPIAIFEAIDHFGLIIRELHFVVATGGFASNVLAQHRAI